MPGFSRLAQEGEKKKALKGRSATHSSMAQPLGDPMPAVFGAAALNRSRTNQVRLKISGRRGGCLRGGRVPLVVSVLGLLIASSCFAGQISYPALGNFCNERGTIEFWFIPRFDPSDTADNRYPLLMSLQQNRENYLHLMWRVHDGHAGVYATAASHGSKFTPMYHLAPDWLPDRPHHLAYCWEPGRSWWIIDGKKTVEAVQHLRFAFRSSEALRLVFGSEGDSIRWVIDDLRISSVPREPEEVGCHAPGRLEVDPWTLLLDTFDQPFECDGQRQTQPRIMMPGSELQGGQPTRDCRFVPGVSGTGLAL